MTTSIDSIDNIIVEIRRCFKEGNHKEALKYIIKGIVHYGDCRSYNRLTKVNDSIIFSDEEINKLILEDSLESNYLLAYMRSWGKFGVQYDAIGSHNIYAKLACQGVGYAMYRIAMNSLNCFGIMRDDKLILSQLMAARDKNIAEAIYTLGLIYDDKSEYGVLLELPENLYLAAMYYKEAHKLGDSMAHNSLNYLYKYCPNKIIPFGIWSKDNHFLVNDSIRNAMRTWLIIYSKLGIPRGVHMMIVEYICTRG